MFKLNATGIAKTLQTKIERFAPFLFHRRVNLFKSYERSLVIGIFRKLSTRPLNNMGVVKYSLLLERGRGGS